MRTVLFAVLATVAISGCSPADSPAENTTGNPDECPETPAECPETPAECPEGSDETPECPESPECPEAPECPEPPDENPGGCADPLAAVLQTLDCVEREDVTCASAGYTSDFLKFHNGKDTNAMLNWQAAFQFVDLALDMNHEAVVGPNQVSLRYVESVTFTDGEVFLQHEHALVTVDDECRMTFWDQYGDDAEQRAVDIKLIEIIINPPQP